MCITLLTNRCMLPGFIALLLFVLLLSQEAVAFSPLRPRFNPHSTVADGSSTSTSTSTHMQRGMIPQLLNDFSMILCDTSVNDEDVLAVSGAASSLPDPGSTVALAGVILLGVAVLQFSLGDLTKQEGQARVRDFLKTREDTERKRGYFD